MAFICFTVLIFLNISAFQYCFFFAGFLKIIAPGRGFSTIFLPQGSGFRTFFVPRGNSPFQKIPQGGGWWSGLELTDT